MQSAAILCLLFVLCVSKDLPSFIEKCKISEGLVVENCIKDRINTLKPRLKNGIPELKLPPIDPFHLPKMEIHTGTGSNVAFDAVLTDIKVTGLMDAVIDDLTMDLKTMKSALKIKFPSMQLVGNYEMKGKVLVFEIDAKGPMSGNLTNVESVTEFTIKILNKDNQRYIEFNNDDFDVVNKFEKANLRFDNIFANDDFTDQINLAVNENAQDLAKEVSPLIHQAAHLIVVGLISPIFKDYSIEELFIIE